MKNKSKIVEGLVNKIIDKDSVRAVADARMKICNSCEFIDNKGDKCAVPLTNPCCSKCGCSLGIKTYSLSSECPVGKWKALLTEEEEENLNL
jgi:hypothetical protein